VGLVLSLYLLVRLTDEADQFLLLVFRGLFREEAVVLFLVFENVLLLLRLATVMLDEIVVHFFNVVLVLLPPR
jgi:hypothetical protein